MRWPGGKRRVRALGVKFGAGRTEDKGTGEDERRAHDGEKQLASDREGGDEYEPAKSGDDMRVAVGEDTHGDARDSGSEREESDTEAAGGGGACRLKDQGEVLVGCDAAACRRAGRQKRMCGCERRKKGGQAAAGRQQGHSLRGARTEDSELHQKEKPEVEAARGVREAHARGSDRHHRHRRCAKRFQAL